MPRTADHPDANVLARYAAGDVDADELPTLEEHVLACDSCCRRLEELPDDALVRTLRDADAATAAEDDSTAQASPAVEPVEGRRCDAADPALEVALREHPRYRLLGVCGVGGMGAVYRAEHRLMGREVALKVVSPEMTHRPDAVERFRREVRTAARLAHPNVVAAYDAEQLGTRHVLVMEYVPGRTLAEVVAATGSAAGRRGVRLRPSGGGRLAVRPRAGHGPPRRQAAQPHAHADGNRQNPRLRPRQSNGRRVRRTRRRR